jgi:hypothetical protein
MTDIEIQNRANETINSLADKYDIPDVIDIIANALINACKIWVGNVEADCGQGEMLKGYIIEKIEKEYPNFFRHIEVEYKEEEK